MPEILTAIPSDETKERIGKGFFGDCFESLGGLDAFDEYFKYYQEEIDRMHRGVTSDTDQLKDLVVRTHDDLITVASVLRENLNKTKSKIRTELRNGRGLMVGEDSLFDRAIDLTLKLWLQINTWDDDSDKDIPRLRWDETSTLTMYVKSLFPIEDLSIGARERRLDALFTVANMVEICELKIEWTNNMDDHLYLDRQRKALSVFPCKRSLQALLPRTGSSFRSPLPEGILEETIKSLNLLFPFWDEQTRLFLENQGQTFHEILGPAEQCRSLDLLAFSHWRERIFILYEEIYLSVPDTWKRMKKDKRNPQMYYTFWFAWYILWLTVISTVASVVSVIIALVQLRMAVASPSQNTRPVTCTLSSNRT